MWDKIRRKIQLNKKAGLLDLVLFIALAFILVLVLVLLTYATNTAHTAITGKIPQLQASMGNGTNVTEIVENTIGKVESAYESFKWIAPLLIFGFALSILIFSFLVRTHPVYLVGYALMVVIAIILSVPVSNTYETLLSNGVLAGTFYSFSISNVLLLHLPIWVTVIGLLAGALMYMNIDWGNYYA